MHSVRALSTDDLARNRLPSLQCARSRSVPPNHDLGTPGLHHRAEGGSRFPWPIRLVAPGQPSRLDSDGEAAAVLEGTNLAYALDERQVVRVNDNADRLFAFRSVRNTLWVVCDELRGLSNWKTKAESAQSSAAEVALASRRKTDILRLRPAVVPVDLRLGPPLPSEPRPAESSLYARARVLFVGPPSAFGGL